MTLVLRDGKEYKLSKFSPLVGRKVFAFGTIPTRPQLKQWLGENDKRTLLITSHISVQLSKDFHLPLTTNGLIDNHVKDSETLCDIVWQLLWTNFPEINRFADNSSIPDYLFNELREAVEIAIDNVLEEWE